MGKGSARLDRDQPELLEKNWPFPPPAREVYRKRDEKPKQHGVLCPWNTGGWCDCGVLEE